MEQIRFNNRKANVRTLLCVLALAVFFVLLLWRVPFGYDWTDEQYYSEIAYRLLQGDRPLIDTWEVHQFSAMLSAPVLKVFLLCNGGSTDGMVLFLRYFAVSFQFGVSLLAFFLLRRRNGALPALLAAGMLLAYAHFSINSYYYNSMTLQFAVLSGLFCMEFFRRTTGGYAYAALGGFCYALAVVAYPYFLLFAPVYLSYWLVRLRERSVRKRSARGLLAFAAGAVAVAMALAGFLLSRASVSQLLTGVSNMLGDPDHQSQSLLEVTGQYFNAIRVVYSPASYGAAALLLIGAVSAASRREHVRQTLRTAGAAATVLLLLGIVWIALRYDWHGIYRINLLAMGFALLAPGLYLLSDRTKDDGTLLLFWIGCGLSFSVQIGSNTRILASSGMLLPASIATVLYLFSHRELLRVPMGKHDAKRCSGALRAAATLACAACVAGLLFLRLTAVHRDEPIPQLTATIESGAAKGVHTTKKSAVQHDQLIADLRAHAPASGSILITYLFPEGYLVTGLRAATPSAFNMAMDSAWLAQYYEQHPERQPDLVFALDPSLDYNEDGQTGIGTFANDPMYERLDCSTGTVFIRTVP